MSSWSDFGVANVTYATFRDRAGSSGRVEEGAVARGVADRPVFLPRSSNLTDGIKIAIVWRPRFTARRTGDDPERQLGLGEAGSNIVAHSLS